MGELAEGRYRKVSADGRVFVLELHPDRTLTEWLADEPGSTWTGTWTLSRGKTASAAARFLRTEIGPYVTTYVSVDDGRAGWSPFLPSREEPGGVETHIVRLDDGD